MARVDFYGLSRDPAERVLPAIANRVLGGGERLLIVAGPAMQRQAIDAALWTLKPASFLPHAMAETPDAAREPMLIAGALSLPAANGAPPVSLADGEWRGEALGVDRVSLLFVHHRIDDPRAP